MFIHTREINMGLKCRITTILAISAMLVSLTDSRADSPDTAPASRPAPTTISHADFCFLVGLPPPDVHYEKIKRLKLGKKTYGLMGDLLKEFADKASSLGADAVINYAGSQRFGFFPWRMVRPAARGQAIKWESPKPDCKSIGGSTLEDILNSNDGPHRKTRS
jgi:hypothetical protein